MPGLKLKEMERSRAAGMLPLAHASGWKSTLGPVLITPVSSARDETDTIAVGCPFCKLMMQDGATTKARSQNDGYRRDRSGEPRPGGAIGPPARACNRIDPKLSPPRAQRQRIKHKLGPRGP